MSLVLEASLLAPHDWHLTPAFPGGRLSKVKAKVKLKTRKGAAKRFKLSAGGKIIRGHSHARHLLTWKSSKRKRKLDQSTQVSEADARRVRAMLPYGRD